MKNMKNKVKAKVIQTLAIFIGILFVAIAAFTLIPQSISALGGY